MNLQPEEITIAVTVFGRRDYLKQAIRSALDQTVPVRVIVVEDCGPDPQMEQFVRGEFGTRVDYFRNPRRRGIFGNWNACMERCVTRWLSILHDDDLVAPVFVEAMLELARQAPPSGLYFGATTAVGKQGEHLPQYDVPPLPEPWRPVSLEDTIWGTPFAFPGQLFKVEFARAQGGFRETSLYCGDWEMWSRLIAYYGAAQSRVTVAYSRQHDGWDRGTNVVVRSARQIPLSYVQHKRVLHLLRQQGRGGKLDRRAYQRRYAMSTRFLLRYGANLSPRLLRYHAELLLLSQPMHWRYAAFQQAVRLLGFRFIKRLSWMLNRFA